MENLEFIKDMIEFRYKNDIYPVYIDYVKSNNKEKYMELAQIIKKNKDEGLYDGKEWNRQHG